MIPLAKASTLETIFVPDDGEIETLTIHLQANQKLNEGKWLQHTPIQCPCIRIFACIVDSCEGLRGVPYELPVYFFQ